MRHVVVGKKLTPFSFLHSLACTPFAWSETVRIASYNVENYLVMDSMVSGRWGRVSKPSKRENCALSLIANPDILAIQEIGERAFLMNFGKTSIQLTVRNLNFLHGFQVWRGKNGTWPFYRKFLSNWLK